MNLDLTEVVTDPIFQDETGTLYLRRGSITVGDNGLASGSPQDTPIEGSVQAGGGSRLVRMPEGESVADTIQVYTTTPLYPGRGDTPADVILWQGREYVVQSVMDWTSWGDGFVNATCSLQRVRP